jgi:hypothetical protein
VTGLFVSKAVPFERVVAQVFFQCLTEKVVIAGRSSAYGRERLPMIVYRATVRSARADQIG